MFPKREVSTVTEYYPENDYYATDTEVDELYAAAQDLVLRHGDFTLHGFYTFSEDGLPIVGTDPRSRSDEMVPYHQLIIGRRELLRHAAPLVGVVTSNEMQAMDIIYAEECLPVTSEDGSYWPRHVDITVSEGDRELTIMIEPEYDEDDPDEEGLIAKVYHPDADEGEWRELMHTEYTVLMGAVQAIARLRSMTPGEHKRQSD